MTQLGHVTLRSSDPPMLVDCLLGDTMPDYAGGYGGWDEVARPKRSPIASWTGIPARRLSLDLIVDGFATGRWVEGDIAQIEAAARGGQGRAPALVRIDAPGASVPGVDVRWRIDTLTWASVEVDAGGARTRARFTLGLLEAVQDPALATRNAANARRALARATAAATASHATPYIVRTGDTLSSIAARKLGKSSRWREIATLNRTAKHPRRDPKDVRVGETLKLP